VEYALMELCFFPLENYQKRRDFIRMSLSSVDMIENTGFRI
jgi:hypothetical protein